MSFLRAALTVFAVVISIPAQAAEFHKFDRAAFDAAQAQRRPILIDAAASWCPVCASQDHTIKRTATAREYEKLIVFRIDYDGHKPERKAFGVTRHATLIWLRGR